MGSAHPPPTPPPPTHPGYLKAVWRDFLGCRETALELICGADFSCKLMYGAGPGDLGGSRGVGFGRKSRENGLTLLGVGRGTLKRCRGRPRQPRRRGRGCGGSQGAFRGVLEFEASKVFESPRKSSKVLEGPRRSSKGLEGPRRASGVGLEFWGVLEGV